MNLVKGSISWPSISVSNLKPKLPHLIPSLPDFSEENKEPIFNHVHSRVKITSPRKLCCCSRASCRREFYHHHFHSAARTPFFDHPYGWVELFSLSICWLCRYEVSIINLFTKFAGFMNGKSHSKKTYLVAVECKNFSYSLCVCIYIYMFR